MASPFKTKQKAKQLAKKISKASLQKVFKGGGVQRFIASIPNLNQLCWQLIILDVLHAGLAWGENIDF